VRRASSLVEVRRSGIEGRGVFARRRIAKGRRIIEYTGERISDAEGDARYDDDAEELKRTYLFMVGNDELIDAAHGGNEARFINHSCEPNCEAVQDGKRIFIEAIHNIQPGVELTYDYRLMRDGPPKADWKRRYACFCGTKKCRGVLLKLPRRRKRKAVTRRRSGTTA
jgi:SET domain-containing protein